MSGVNDHGRLQKLHENNLTAQSTDGTASPAHLQNLSTLEQDFDTAFRNLVTILVQLSISNKEARVVRNDQDGKRIAERPVRSFTSELEGTAGQLLVAAMVASFKALKGDGCSAGTWKAQIVKEQAVREGQSVQKQVVGEIGELLKHHFVKKD